MASSASSTMAQIERDTGSSSSTGMEIERTKRSTSQRRLDQLAWLLEGSDVCAAVAVIQGRGFYIAANGFFENTQPRGGNRQLDYVCNVMEYFQSIANGAPPAIERKALIMLALERQITASKGGIRIPEDILKLVGNSDELLTENWSDLLEREVKFKSKKDLFYMAIGLASMIFKRVLKIEESIQKARKADFGEISEEQLNAFKNFSFVHKSEKRDTTALSNSNILLLEPKEGVHAELQILSQLIEMVNTDAAPDSQTYIGISKRCCLQCHAFLDAANQVLTREKKSSVIFGGAHDGLFESNWVMPHIFEVVHASRRSQTKALKTRLEDNIREGYVELYRKLGKEDHPPKTFDQRQTPSNSEASYNAEDKFKIYKQRLADDFEAVERWVQQGSNAAKMLKIGLLACETESFEVLFIKLLDNVSLDNKETRTADFFTVFSGMLNKDNNLSGEKVELAEFLQFLQNPQFTNDEIAAYFKDMPAPLAQMSKSEADINVYAEKLTEGINGQIDALSLTPRSKNALLNKITFT